MFYEAHCLGKFTVVEQGVDGDIDTSPVPVRVFGQGGDVLQVVARFRACAIAGSANVDGICATVDGGGATF